MAQLNPKEKDIVREARMMIRDMAAGWAIEELSTTPENMRRQLSELIGEKEPEDV